MPKAAQTKKGLWFVGYYNPINKKSERKYFGRGGEGEEKAKVFALQLEMAKVKRDATFFKKEIKPAVLGLADLLQAYIDDLRRRGGSQEELTQLKSNANKVFLPALGELNLEDITYLDIMRVADEAWGGRDIATQGRKLARLKAAFNFGIKHNLVSDNPLRSWTRPKKKKIQLKLTISDLQKIKEHAAPHLNLALDLLWETAMRAGEKELLELKWSDIDYAHNLLHIRGTKTEGSDRHIPISKKFGVTLRKEQLKSTSEYIISYKGTRIKSLRKAWRGAVGRAGLDYLPRMYDIRHLSASDMLANGADLAAVSALLGHSSISTTQEAYYHILKGEKERAIKLRTPLDKANAQ